MEEIKGHNMKITKTALNDVYIIEPQVFGDNRGWFMETYRKCDLEKIGCFNDFIQDNHSYSSTKGTLRGIHFQNFPHAQSKIVRCIRGKILDVAVDLRKNSPQYKEWISVELSEDNKKQLFIPKGFGHGFVALTPDVEIAYKVDDFYSKECDRSIAYNDASLNVKWGVTAPILSEKDKSAPTLENSDCNFGERVLVTGYKGQLGFDVVKKLNSIGVDCLGVDIEDFDITDHSQTEAFILKYNPTAIIHCAAYTAVDKAETEPDKCFAINAQGTQNLVSVCEKIDAKFLYISTDYVYSGNGETPFIEADAPQPLNIYGKTKLYGENQVQSLKKHFIIRTSWVFGKHGNNFVKTMLTLAKTKNVIKVVGDQIGSPTYTKDLAELITTMIFSNKYGTYNATNESYCSWYQFAKKIFELSGINISVEEITSQEYLTKAVRPKNSRLSKEKLLQSGFMKLPYWENALQRYLTELNIGDNI